MVVVVAFQHYYSPRSNCSPTLIMKRSFASTSAVIPDPVGRTTYDLLPCTAGAGHNDASALYVNVAIISMMHQHGISTLRLHQ